jgi:hypothetical protein
MVRGVLGGEPVEGVLATADPVDVARRLGIPEEVIDSIPASEGVSREEMAVLERIAVLRIL